MEGRAYTTSVPVHSNAMPRSSKLFAIQLNETSLWRGNRADRLNPRAHDGVPEIRQMRLDRLNCPNDGKQMPAKQNVHRGWQK